MVLETEQFLHVLHVTEIWTSRLFWDDYMSQHELIVRLRVRPSHRKEREGEKGDVTDYCIICESKSSHFINKAEKRKYLNHLKEAGTIKWLDRKSQPLKPKLNKVLSEEQIPNFPTQPQRSVLSSTAEKAVSPVVHRERHRFRFLWLCLSWPAGGNDRSGLGESPPV